MSRSPASWTETLHPAGDGGCNLWHFCPLIPAVLRDVSVFLGQVDWMRIQPAQKSAAPRVGKHPEEPNLGDMSDPGSQYPHNADWCGGLRRDRRTILKDFVPPEQQGVEVQVTIDSKSALGAAKFAGSQLAPKRGYHRRSDCLSVGLEETDDILWDLVQALRASA